MQTTIDISIDIQEEHLSKLDKLSEDRHVSRNEIIQAALITYLQSQNVALDDSFGLWAGAQGDGLEYQRRLRDEW